MTPVSSCRLILSCSAGAFFLLVFAIFRGKIQVFRTRLVGPHQQDGMHSSIQASYGQLIGMCLYSPGQHHACCPVLCRYYGCLRRTCQVSGKHHRTCQWEASTISGESSPCHKASPSSSDLPFTNGAIPFWGVHHCKIYLSHSPEVCSPSDSEHLSHFALSIITVQVMAGPSVHLLRHGPDADSRHGLSHAQLAEHAGHTDILSAHSRGPCGL